MPCKSSQITNCKALQMPGRKNTIKFLLALMRCVVRAVSAEPSVLVSSAVRLETWDALLPPGPRRPKQGQGLRTPTPKPGGLRTAGLLFASSPCRPDPERSCLHSHPCLRPCLRPCRPCRTWSHFLPEWKSGKWGPRRSSPSPTAARRAAGPPGNSSSSP